MPGRDQVDALARMFRVPAGALLSELANTLDPARTRASDLLAAYRSLNTRQQGRAARGRARSMKPARRPHGEQAQAQTVRGPLLEPMQVELANAARWLQHTGRRLVVVFGSRHRRQGGAIDTIHRHLSPRQCRVAALPKPTERRNPVGCQRYAALPRRRRDRAVRPQLVQPRRRREVIGFASDARVAAFLRDAPVFERQLVEDGILLFKYWLGCDQAVQEDRFAMEPGRPAEGAGSSRPSTWARALPRLRDARGAGRRPHRACAMDAGRLPATRSAAA